MELAGGDAHLRAEAVAVAVGKARGAVLVHARRVHQREEALRSLLVLGDDAVRMVGAVAVDVRDGLVQRIDDADGDHIVQILGLPVRLRGALARDARHQRLRPRVGLHLHARHVQRARHGRQRLRRRVLVHQQRLRRVACRRVLGLRVHGHARRHPDVARRIEVDVAHAVTVAQHGDAAVVHDVAHKAVRAARDDEVDVLVHGQHRADLLARGQQARPALGHAGGLAGLLHHVKERTVGAHRLAAALEEHRVAALEAQSGDLHQRVRAGFKDHADHADRAAHAGEHKPLRQLRAQLLVPDGVLHLRQRAQARAHVVELALVKFQPLQCRRGKALGLRRLQILRVRREDRLFAILQRVSHSQERAIAHLRGGCRQGKARLSGAPGDFLRAQLLSAHS